MDGAPEVIRACGPGVDVKSGSHFLLRCDLAQMALALLASMEQEWVCLDSSYEEPTKCQGQYQLLGDTEIGKIRSQLPGSSNSVGERHVTKQFKAQDASCSRNAEKLLRSTNVTR